MSSRARSSRPTPPARAQPTSQSREPPVAARGHVSNQYGTDDVQPIRTGAADLRKGTSFAAELRQQLQSSNASPPSSQLTSDQSEQPISSPSQRKSSRMRVASKSPGRTSRAETEAKKRMTPSVVLEEIPSGIGIDRSFDDLHEAGLEMPAEPAFISFVRSISLEDVGWTLVYTLPLLCITFLFSPLGNQMTASVSTFVSSKLIASVISSIESSRSATPSVRFNTSTVIHTVTSVPTYVNPGRKDNSAKYWDEVRQELKGIRGQLSSLSTRVDEFDAWKSTTLRPNFLSPRLGAVIDPRFTSPTNPFGLGLFTRIYKTLYHRIVRDHTSLPPAEALRPWKENGDCWCAAGAPSGQLSLGVILGREIHPMRFVVEHIPRSAALDPATTPKTLDLWARLAPSAAGDLPQEWQNNAKHCQSSRPEESKREEWICLGKMQYDINSALPSQSLSLAGYNGGAPPFKVDRVAVRVSQNHGAQFTCLYQIKLEGILSLDE
jgi:hypothetical protein